MAAYDVIVIGSGVCGAIAAFRLGAAGKVLVLEAGHQGKPRIDLVGQYARAINKTPGSPYVEPTADRVAPGPETVAGYYHHVNDGHSDQLKSGYLRRIGGSTWHFLGNVPRFVPTDFELKTRYGVGVDWPLTYDELERDYCDAEGLLGVSGDHEQWQNLHGATRSRSFPMPHIWESYSDRRVTPHVESVIHEGAQLRVMRTPQARNSRPFDDRPPCAGNSSCVPICPIQAKYDATVHVRKAKQLGVEVRERAVVTALVANPLSGLVDRVRYTDWEGRTHEETARVVVVAAHAVESAKLLLHSKADGSFANSSGQVGRNLMDHPQGAGACIANEPLFPFRGPPTTSGIDTLRDGAFRANHAAFRMSLGNDGWGRLEPPVKTVQSLIESGHFGSDLRQRVEHRLTRQFRISYSTEMLPESENRVTLSNDRDALGLPMPAIRFRVSAYTQAAFLVARDVIAQVMTKMGGSEIQFSPTGTGYSGAGHIMGTCRMAADQASGVVNRDGQTFEHPNLFIVGPAVFPTSGTANPTLTAVALTLRATRRIERELARLP